MAYQYDVFISYRREPDSKEWTQKVFLPKFRHYLQEELGKKNLEIFIDEQGIEGGDYWRDTIKDALATSKCLVPVLMTSYFQSEWCVREFAAMYHRQEQYNIKQPGLIVPFTVWDGDFFPPNVKKIQAFKCHDFYLTGKGFMDSPDYLEFQKKLKTWVQSVSQSIQSAPDWKKTWLQPPWSEPPSDQFLLDEDLNLKIKQPRNF